MRRPISAALIGAALACGDLSPVGGGAAGGAAPTTTTDSTGGAGYPTTTTTKPATGDDLGTRCTVDVNCAGALRCAAASSDEGAFHGGPAGGYCTKTCAVSTDCPGEASVCYRADAESPGVCVLGCELGPALTEIDDELLASKCHGRDDLRCASFETVAGCMPTCGEDEQCPPGRYCDPRWSVCVDASTPGKPMGASCDPTRNDECEGLCVQVTGSDPPVAFCSSDCTLGGSLLETHDCGGPAEGLCAFSPSLGSGSGDAGVCAEICHAHVDCQLPTFACRTVEGLTESIDGGYCLFTTACAEVGQDCGSQGGPAGLMCTDALDGGPLCLDPGFPFDSSGGSSGSGGA